MNHRIKKTVIAVLASCLLLTVASCSADEATADETIGVAVTIVPQAEFVEKVGGDKVDVTIMVPPGASPHTYELTPSQMAALSKAKMYAKVGSGVEFEFVWMDKIIAQNQDMTIIDCSQSVTLLESVSADEHETEEEHEHEEEHDHGAMDPHIWMSPVNVKTMVQNIAEGLIELDPDNASYYEQNRDAYLAELDTLDEDIRDGLAEVTNRTFMVYHPSFGYFADCYDLTMLPVEDDGKEPTPAGLEHLIEQAKEHGIRVVFASPQFNPQSAEVIADAIDGSVILINPLAAEYENNLRMLLSELVQSME